MDAFEKVGTKVAREAGILLMERFRSDFAVSHKGAINLVTEVDVAAEDLIVSGLKAAFPNHAILAEENHADAAPCSHTWIVDPLDGTTNYAHGYPVFAVSVALQIDSEVEFGVVYDPYRNELFTARRGMGATLNGVPIHVSQTSPLGVSLLATGFPYDIRTSGANNLDNFNRFALCSQGIRRAGSAALDLSYVACGRFDGFWELKLHPWDCAAGYLLVREAGGLVTNFLGARGSIYERECIASNCLIHEEMQAVLNAKP